jgi:tetratricopeptide (TPR) repeat protein
MKALLELLDQLLALLERSNHDATHTPQLQRLLEELAREALIMAQALRREQELRHEQDHGAAQRELLTQRALEAIAQGRWHDAEHILEDAIAAFPEHEEYYNHLGLIAWERGDMLRAERHYARAAEIALSQLDPCPDPWMSAAGRAYLRSLEGQALCLYKLQRLDDARQLFDTLAHTRLQDYQGCHYLAGEILHTQGQWAQAELRYRRAPQEPAILYNLGLVCFHQQRLPQAAAAFVRAFASNRHIAERLLHLPPSAPTGLLGFIGSPGYADEFLDACAHLWRDDVAALAFLAHCWEDPLVQQQVIRVKLDQPAQSDWNDEATDGTTEERSRLDALTRHILSRMV